MAVRDHKWKLVDDAVVCKFPGCGVSRQFTDVASKALAQKAINGHWMSHESQEVRNAYLALRRSQKKARKQLQKEKAPPGDKQDDTVSKETTNVRDSFWHHDSGSFVSF